MRDLLNLANSLRNACTSFAGLFILGKDDVIIMYFIYFMYFICRRSINWQLYNTRDLPYLVVRPRVLLNSIE